MESTSVKIVTTSVILFLIGLNICVADFYTFSKSMTANNSSSYFITSNDTKSVQQLTEKNYLATIAHKTVGASSQTLARIPLSLEIMDSKKLPLTDTDSDGLVDELELAVGTDPHQKNTDKDQFDDYTELKNGYNPKGAGKASNDLKLANRVSGQFLLDVENKGLIWYVDPINKKRILFSNPSIRSLYLNSSSITTVSQNTTPSSHNEMIDFADSIRRNDLNRARELTSTSVHKAIEYTLAAYSNEQRLTWANLLSSASLETESGDIKIYSVQVYYSPLQKKITSKFTVKKMGGAWLLTEI